MRRALVVLALAAGLGACVNTPAGETPEWADTEGFPSLHDVPSGGSSATTDPAHWRAVEADLLAARQQVQANPRLQNTPAPVEDPQAFIEDARREIEETRNAHNPY
ncbi:MAG: hypothetical protein ACT4OF_15310 [Caulobacteraceae bacterium]